MCITLALIIFFTATAFATSVSFSQSTYSVNEDDELIKPVLVLSSPSMTDITVVIECSDGTATGMLFLILQIILYSNIYLLIGSEDYDVGPYNVTFPAGDTKVSFNVTIIDDEILESNEIFQLSINSEKLPVNVIVNNLSNITVTILDDDCKLLILYNILFIL